jgi:hypothetical protein
LPREGQVYEADVEDRRYLGRGDLLWLDCPLAAFHVRCENIMSKGLFTAWVVVGLIWLFIALLVANFYPLIDGGV